MSVPDSQKFEYSIHSTENTVSLDMVGYQEAVEEFSLWKWFVDLCRILGQPAEEGKP